MKKLLFAVISVVVCIANGVLVGTVSAQNQSVLIWNSLYVNVVNSGAGSALDFTTGDFTLEAWVLPSNFLNNTNNFSHTFLGNDSIATSGGGGYVLRTGGNRKLSFAFYDGVVWQELVTSNSVMVAGQWQHVAVTKQGGAINLYLNGANVASTLVIGNTNIASSPKTLKIGENGSISNRRFNGRIDEVKIWNVARTQQQVQSDGTEICGSIPTNIIAYYKLNDTGNLTTNPIVCANNTGLNGTINGPITSLPGAILLPAGTTDLYVDSFATATGCGLQIGYSWPTAYADLNTAINVAQTNPQIERIYVAKGTYHPMFASYTMQSNGIGVLIGSGYNVDKTFHLRQGLEMYGGYPNGGGIPVPSVYRTILDGSMAGGGLTDTANNVVYMDGSTNWLIPNDTTKLIGFTITNGKADLTNGYDISGGYGGGVYCNHGINLIQNCVIRNNKSLNIGAGISSDYANTLIIGDTITNNTLIPGGNGGGIYLHYANSATVADNYIANNDRTGIYSWQSNSVIILNNTIANNGSRGIYVSATNAVIEGNHIHHNITGGIGTMQCQLSIINNIIEDHYTGGFGAGINFYGGTQQIIGNIIRRDTAYAGAGIYWANGANTVVSNMFSDNIATSGGGGGIWGDGGGNREDGNIFFNNQAAQGGGMRLDGFYDTVINNVIVQNTASGYCGGAIVDAVYSIVVNNVIAENTAPFVGGADVNGINIHVANNTFLSNQATDSNGYNAGGLEISNGQVNVHNNIFWKNKVGSSDIAPGADYYNSYGNNTFKHNALQRSASSYTMVGSGNYDLGVDATNNFFTTDPLFANEASIAGADGIFATNDDGLQLLHNSPFINAGADSLFPAFITGDITDAARIYGNAIDLGAYELSCAPANISTQQQSTLCVNGNTVLQVNSVVSPQNIKWYADSASTAVIGTGYSFTTGVLTATDTFWVAADSCYTSTKIPVIVNMSAPTSSAQNVSTCDSFFWNLTGQNYTISGTYHDTLVNTTGCDSFITLNLLLTTSTSGAESISACDAYIWSLNGQNYTASGVYHDTIANTAGCDSFVTLNLSLTNAVATVTQNGSTLDANIGASSYQWLTCGPYAIIPGATASTYTATVSGTYAVVVEQNGCIDTSACTQVTLGVHEYDNDTSITITPNPAHNVVTVSLPPSLHDAKLQVRNALGQIVLEVLVNARKSLNVDLTGFASGVYYVEISDGTQHYTGKLLKL